MGSVTLNKIICCGFDSHSKNICYFSLWCRSKGGVDVEFRTMPSELGGLWSILTLGSISLSAYFVTCDIERASKKRIVHLELIDKFHILSIYSKAYREISIKHSALSFPCKYKTLCNEWRNSRSLVFYQIEKMETINSPPFQSKSVETALTKLSSYN